jgi:hypothetical protein
MPIDYEHLMSLRTRSERVQYTDRDTLLYALGVGLGRDARDRNELAYVSGPAGLKTLPTFASTLAGAGLLDDCGWNATQVVACDEAVSLGRPLDDAGALLIDSDVAAVLDKGAGAGALVTVESRARRERDGEPVFTVSRSWLARGDGGFGGPRGGPSGSSIERHPVPRRRPDMAHTCATRFDQGLLFSLAAERDGRRPGSGTGLTDAALHPLCLQGIACLAILREICDYDHTLVRSLAVTHLGDAFPGETLVAELWQDANVVSCRLRVLERDVLVLDHGRCLLAD